MDAHQTAHDSVCACLSALSGLEAQLNEPIARMAEDGGYERQDGLAVLQRYAGELVAGIKTIGPLLSEVVPVWREARRRLGPLERLLNHTDHSAHELVVVVSCDIIGLLRQAENTPAAVYRVLDQRRLNRADLETLWVRVEEEHAESLQQDQDKAGDNGSDRTGDRAKKGRGKNVNGRMLDAMMKDPDKRGWTCSKWANFLKCVPSTVVGTMAWKELELFRATLKAEQVEESRRLRKASNTRRE